MHYLCLVVEDVYAIHLCGVQSVSNIEVRRKKKEDDDFSHLPEDLLLEIFNHLPPNLLRYKVKYVCRKWFNLITNKILLDDASLILEKPSSSQKVRLIDINEEKQGLEMKEQYVFIPYNGIIKCWCNEYLLITDKQNTGSLFMFNLITKRGSFLPPSSTSCGENHRCKCGVGLSYDEFKGVYKVVHVFMGPPVECELLVLSSNDIRYNWSKWKKVNGPIYAGQRQYYWDDPVLVQGRYLHWDVHCPKYLLSMDTVKERFRQTCLPAPLLETRYSLVEMSGVLALLHKNKFDRVNIWMLKDFRRTKWEKFYSISVWSWSFVWWPTYSEILVSFAVTSVRSRRYIIFKKPGSDKGLYGFDLKNKTMKKLAIDIAFDERCVVHSTSSSFC